jgi:hypothetical protein
VGVFYDTPGVYSREYITGDEMTEDEWAIFERAPKPLESAAEAASIKTSELADLAEKLFEAEEQLAEVKRSADILSEQIAAQFPHEAGKQTRTLGDLELTVSCSERWEWDHELLAALYEQGKLPSFVTRKLSVDRKIFDRLPSDAQDDLRAALTRKLMKPQVKVAKCLS